MSISLLFPEFMDHTKPCLTCTFYCKSESVSDNVRRVADKKRKGEVVEYEYGQKSCIRHKEYVFFNWNCNEYVKKERY